MATMRAKLQVGNVEKFTNEQGETTGERLNMFAVGPTDGYPSDGSDENNSYAKWSPSASFEISIANPNLFGKFSVGQRFYVDFTEAPDHA